MMTSDDDTPIDQLMDDGCPHDSDDAHDYEQQLSYPLWMYE